MDFVFQHFDHEMQSLKNKSAQTDLNHRPTELQSVALPLSYGRLSFDILEVYVQPIYSTYILAMRHMITQFSRQQRCWWHRWQHLFFLTYFSGSAGSRENRIWKIVLYQRGRISQGVHVPTHAHMMAKVYSTDCLDVPPRYVKYHAPKAQE